MHFFFENEGNNIQSFVVVVVCSLSVCLIFPAFCISTVETKNMLHEIQIFYNIMLLERIWIFTSDLKMIF